MSRAAVARRVFGEASPVCPVCGSGLFARPSGDLACAQHGHWVPADVLARIAPGADRAARSRAEAGAVVGRKCPKDRLALARYTTPSGRVGVEGCGRCGGAWVPAAEIDKAAASATTPPGANAAEARSLLALGAVRSAVVGVAPAPR